MTCFGSACAVAVLVVVTTSSAGPSARAQQPGGATLRISVNVVQSVSAPASALTAGEGGPAGAIAARRVRSAASSGRTAAAEFSFAAAGSANHPRSTVECRSTEDAEQSAWREELRAQPPATLCTTTFLPE
jgi:hypothetical protein